MSAYAFQAQKVEVLDGDTVKLKDVSNGAEFKVRLFCIDAPEKDQAYGMESKEHLEKILPLYMDVIPIGGSYDRIVAVLTSDNRIINFEMVKDGYAWVYIEYCKSSHKQKLTEYQNIAKTNKLGMWKSNNNIPPWDWRKERKK
jgi:endonuclease YncB( thermonuclease family)